MNMLGYIDKVQDAITNTLTTPFSFTLSARPSVLCLAMLGHLPRLSDLVHCFEFCLDPPN